MILLVSMGSEVIEKSKFAPSFPLKGYGGRAAGSEDLAGSGWCLTTSLYLRHKQKNHRESNAPLPRDTGGDL